MGMSTRVYGIRPPNEKWERMKAVWDACTAAGVPVPDEVSCFFDDEEPDPDGVVVDLTKDPCVKPLGHEFSNAGFVVDLELLPKDIRFLRFTNTW